MPSSNGERILNPLSIFFSSQSISVSDILVMDLYLVFPLFSLLLSAMLSVVSCVTMWDRATVVCDTNGKKHVVEENSDRVVVLDYQCQAGEVAWRLSQTYVYLRFRKPSRFRVCFSSPAFPGLEKYAVYSMTAEGSRLAGSPNKNGDVCVMSQGPDLNIALKALNVFYVLTAKFIVNCV
uniref:Uncharacterized protein LOC111099475 n=1 Tax=Crassostrea virginica TaxID=6565 RepID=A0A8B8A4R0_CRAVI|nr:uncharacterized protein LOC111099475 [Crassostrea virginica]